MYRDNDSVYHNSCPNLKAAKSSIYLASSPDAEQFTGKYVDSRCRIIASLPTSYDEEVAAKVWTLSAELTGLEHRSSHS